MPVVPGSIVITKIDTIFLNKINKSLSQLSNIKVLAVELVKVQDYGLRIHVSGYRG